MYSFSIAKPTPSPRCLMWIDGVGGYLVVFGTPVTIGQAVSGNRVDIPLMADVSRRHASIVRESERYLLVPHALTRVSGRRATGPTGISDGDLLHLGESVELRFRQPHPLSSTGRLEFLSHHRTVPSADGVLLLGNVCVLGPDPRSHVVCPQWNQTLTLVRRDNQLLCRAPAGGRIDGEPIVGESPLGLDSRLTGDDYCVSLERIE